MIQGISPQIIAEISKNLADPQKTFVTLPPENSIVDFKILDKIGDTYKILVKGFLFQAKFPMELLAGDQLMGKVVNHKPFTLMLDNLAASGNIPQAFLSDILSRFDLKDSGLAKKLLEAVVKSGKSLVKSRLEKLIELASGYSVVNDELLVNLMINVLWSDENNLSLFKENGFGKVFDLSFDELVKRIAAHFGRIINSESDSVLSELISKNLVVDIFEHNAKINHTLFRNRDDVILEILDYLAYNGNQGFNRQQNNELRQILSKYLLQKSVYHRFNLARDFILFRDQTEISHIIFSAEIPQNSNVPVIKISVPFNTINREGGFILNITDQKITGNIFIPEKQLSRYIAQIVDFNEEFAKISDTPSNIILSPQNFNNDRTGHNSIGSINVRV